MESWRTCATRHLFNLFPAYVGTGARVRYIAADWREVRIDLPLTWRTRNYVGTIFGGSMFAAVDPFYMIMLIKNLGPAFEIWDKAASIRFRRPGRSTLRARFLLPASELAAIHDSLRGSEKVERAYSVDLVADDGTVCASAEKLISIRRRGYW